jgi:hypothetical protein
LMSVLTSDTTPSWRFPPAALPPAWR